MTATGLFDRTGERLLACVRPESRPRAVTCLPGEISVDGRDTSIRDTIPGRLMVGERRTKPMIKGVHTMFHSSEPEALRVFLRDKLGFSSFTDVGEGWLIFDLPEADMGVHPSAETGGHGLPAGTHDVSFYCDDLRATVAELEGRGVEFDGDVVDAGFGLMTHFGMPGGVRVMLYQPHYRKGAG